MNQSSPLRVVIAGGGSAGWMAAAVLARFLGEAGQVTLVESDAIAAVGVGEATIPQIQLLLSGLGIDEAEFVRETSATYKLGIEFEGWTQPGHGYMHAFGTVGRAVGIVPFRQLWHRAATAGAAQPFGDYAFNEVAARLGRVGRLRADGPVPDLVRAFHFDASLFGAYLRRYSEARRVTRIEGKIGGIERTPERGDITALLLEGDRRVAGDLFLDCTGFRALLIGDALGVPYADWSAMLPCDRAVTVASPRTDTFHPYTQSLARKAGWQWRIPLQHRTGNGHVYCSRFISDDEAAGVLLANLESEPLGEPRTLRFTAGQRAQSWAHNCISLGLSAGFMEPLESTSIHLVQSALARLLTFLPQSAAGPTARDSYNRLTASEWEHIRDFLVLHYKANGRVGEPFWDERRAMSIPDSLERKIALFEEAAIILREDGELFTEEGWGQVMIGQGLQPRGFSPLAEAIPMDELNGYLSKLAATYRVAAEHLPDHASFVAQAVGSTPAPLEPVA